MWPKIKDWAGTFRLFAETRIERNPGKTLILIGVLLVWAIVL